MLKLFGHSGILTRCAFTLLLCGATSQADAQESSLNTIADHSHQPITVRSKPVIERLPVKVVRPIDLAITSGNQILVADSGAECIFQLEPNGTVALRAQKLADIKRICVDADDSVYVLTSTPGESRIHQITPDGKQTVLHQLAAPATCFARLPNGDFAVAGDKLFLASFDAAPRLLRELNQPAVDMTLHSGGGAELLFGSGVVMSLASSGELNFRGTVLPASHRLVSLPDGRLAGLAADGLQKTGLFALMPENLSSDAQPVDQNKAVAHVPHGTLAVGFDQLGNLALANPDLRAITKVTSHFEVPCPHCGKPTRLNMVPADPAGSDTTSF